MVILKIIPQLLNLTSNFEKKARCRMCLSYYKNTHSKKYPKTKTHFQNTPFQNTPKTISDSRWQCKAPTKVQRRVYLALRALLS